MNIGFGSPTNLIDFINILKNNLGVEIKQNLIKPQKGDVERTFASVQKLYDYTGYKPKVSLKNGVNQFIQWYKKYHKI